MTRTTLARLATALLTVAGGLTLVAGPASADTTAGLRLSTASGSAGTCLVLTATPVDARGVQATDAGTVTVTLSESPNSGTQDVDFCTTPTTTALTGSARYTEAGTGVGPAVKPGSGRTYTPGPSVTLPGGPSSGGSPDSADNTAAVLDPAPSSSNPSGTDTASFAYSGGVVRFGVVGLLPGGAEVRAVVDGASSASAAATVAFRDGGLPGSQEAADAVRTLDAEPETASAVQGSTTTFPAVVRNASGDTVAGVTPLLRVASGPNAARADQVRADCGPSSNDGVATCVFGGNQAGTDTLQVWVQQSGGTVGPDAGEPQDEITRRTTLAPVDPPLARYVELTPSSVTTVAGRTTSFRATVTSATGAAVKGASLTASESGPGTLGATSLVTDVDGVATATVTTSRNESGTELVKVALADPATTQCQQPKGAGTDATPTTPAGACSDGSVHTVTAASPDPTPSASTPTATVRPVVTLGRSTITSQESVEVRATTFPGALVELHAYSRPSTSYVVVRRGVATQEGTIGFLVGPSGNTRLFVRTTRADGSGQQDSETRVLTVRTSINLKVVRTGVRTYRFTGSTLPKRSGQLVTVFYAPDGGGRVIAARARVSSRGTYDVTRRFTGNGTVTFFTGTGTDINNAANESNRLRAELG